MPKVRNTKRPNTAEREGGLVGDPATLVFPGGSGERNPPARRGRRADVSDGSTEVERLRAQVADLTTRVEELERAILPGAQAASRLSDSTQTLLQFLGGEASIRFSDLMAYAASQGIVTMDPTSPNRAYSALHSRLSHLHRRGLVRRAAWGRWAVTEAGRAVSLTTGPGPATPAAGGQWDGSIDGYVPTTPEQDEEAYRYFLRTGKAPPPPTGEDEE